MVYVAVMPKPRSGQMFTAAVKPNYLIETPAAESLPPCGDFGVAPSIVTIKAPVNGRKHKGTFVIYNNDAVSHHYKITSYVPRTSSNKQDICISPGYERIAKSDWVRVTGETKIRPMAKKRIKFSFVIPEGQVCRDSGWESVIMIEADDGTSDFVRVRFVPEAL